MAVLLKTKEKLDEYAEGALREIRADVHGRVKRLRLQIPLWRRNAVNQSAFDLFAVCEIGLIPRGIF